MTTLSKLATTWTSHVSGKEKEELLKTLSRSSTHMTVLKRILEQKVEALENKSLSVSTYDSPNWPYIQADTVGAIRELKKIIELITPMTEGK